jgi:hypothetical protein
MLSIKEVNSAIMFGNLTNVELSSVIDAVKFARMQLTKQKTRTFSVGDKVKFTSNRNGLTYVGTINKVKIKYILVNTNGGLFNVPANMLESV